MNTNDLIRKIPDWLPEGVSIDKPNVARMYDAYLGGYHNFEVDRAVVEKVLQISPDVRTAAIANRSFLRRTVSHLCTQGIDQFLDIGSGIPTAGNVHEVVQKFNPLANVVYVDIDPIAVTHSLTLLKRNAHATAVLGDIMMPESILGNPEVQRMLDFKRPIGVIMVAVLHFQPDKAAVLRTLRKYRQAVASDSYFVISHGTIDKMPADIKEQYDRLAKMAKTNYTDRSYGEFRRFFDGLEMVEPGLVYVPLWRPEGPEDIFLNEPERSINYGGVGRKP